MSLPMLTKERDVSHWTKHRKCTFIFAYLHERATSTVMYISWNTRDLKDRHLIS